jgi:hypothetical protein
VQTIRYYEQIGLLPVPDRSQGNQQFTWSVTARSGLDSRLFPVLSPHIREISGAGFAQDSLHHHDFKERLAEWDMKTTSQAQ